MTSAQLEAIFKANLDKSFLAALDAVYTQGYMAGKGSSIPSSGIVDSSVSTQAAPATIVKVPHR